MHLWRFDARAKIAPLALSTDDIASRQFVPHSRRRNRTRLCDKLHENSNIRSKKSSGGEGSSHAITIRSLEWDFSRIMGRRIRYALCCNGNRVPHTISSSPKSSLGIFAPALCPAHQPSWRVFRYDGKADSNLSCSGIATCLGMWADGDKREKHCRRLKFEVMR